MTTKYNITFPTKKFYVEVFNSNNQKIMKSKEFIDFSQVHKFIDFLELLEDNYTFVINNTNMIAPNKPPRGNFKRAKMEHHCNNIKYQKPPADNHDDSGSDTDPQMPGLVPCNYCGSDDECDNYVDDVNHIKYNNEENTSQNINMNIWSVLGETKKYEGCIIKKYGRGYDMIGDTTMDFYKQNYLPEKRVHNVAWWQASRNRWFLRESSLQYFLDNGAKLVS